MLTIDLKERIHLITIDRPPVNALDTALLEQLTEAISRAASRSDHALVLSGVPGCFCAGLDTKKLAAASSAEWAGIMDLLRKLLQTVAECPIPVAAAITGHCLGGGAVLAALCDYRVMGKGDYKIGLPEVKLGIELPEKVQRILARLVGSQLAQRLCREGILLDPEQAYRANLVDDLVEAGSVTGTAIDWCERILSLPQATVPAKHAQAREEMRFLYEAE